MSRAADSRSSAPRSGLVAFVWAAVQPLRALWWQLRFGELRALALAPALVTLVVGAGLLSLSVVAAAPLQRLVMEHGESALGQVAWISVRLVIHAVLALAALVATLRLQSAIAGAYLERMSLFVQRRLTGAAPGATVGVGRVLVNTVRALVPGLRSIVLWGLTAAAASTVVLIPAVGPVLVLPVQAVLAAGFLAHGAVIDSRERMGLPRWLYLREPACLLGLTVGFLPFVLFPPLMLVGGGTIAVAGALVAVGLAERRKAAVTASTAPEAAAAPTAPPTPPAPTTPTTPTTAPAPTPPPAPPPAPTPPPAPNAAPTAPPAQSTRRP